MIDKHWDGTTANPATRSCSAFVEGSNNRIRTMQKRAYGFRDEEYLRYKIPTCTLPKL